MVSAVRSHNSSGHEVSGTRFRHFFLGFWGRFRKLPVGQFWVPLLEYIGVGRGSEVFFMMNVLARARVAGAGSKRSARRSYFGGLLDRMYFGGCGSRLYWIEIGSTTWVGSEQSCRLDVSGVCLIECIGVGCLTLARWPHGLASWTGPTG